MIFGAGSAGIGITNQIYKALIASGMDEDKAKSIFYFIDKNGLITTKSVCNATQKKFARGSDELYITQTEENSDRYLYDIVEVVKPTILIGTSGVYGAFNEDVIRKMAEINKRPAILPLSNPNYLSEATPQDIMDITDGRAIIATGSPFPEVVCNGTNYIISQCNNALSFPGIGLGAMSVQASYISDLMLFEASKAICKYFVLNQKHPYQILPMIADAQSVAKYIAIEVAMCAMQSGVAKDNLDRGALIKKLMHIFGRPEYYEYFGQ